VLLEVRLVARRDDLLAGRLLDGVVRALLQVGGLAAEVVLGLLPVAVERVADVVPRGVVFLGPPGPVVMALFHDRSLLCPHEVAEVATEQGTCRRASRMESAEGAGACRFETARTHPRTLPRKPHIQTAGRGRLRLPPGARATERLPLPTAFAYTSLPWLQP